MQIILQRNTIIFEGERVIKKFREEEFFRRELVGRNYLKGWSVVELDGADEKSISISYLNITYPRFDTYLRGNPSRSELFQICYKIKKNLKESPLVDDPLFAPETELDLEYVLSRVYLDPLFMEKVDLTPTHFIHGDLRPYNIFIIPSTLELIVIDLEHSQNGRPEKDLSKLYLESIQLNKTFSLYLLRLAQKYFNYFTFLFYSLFYAIRFLDCGSLTQEEFIQLRGEIFEEIRSYL